MRDKLTKIVAVSVALVMAASCVSLSIAGHATNNASFDDRLPTENVTAVPYHRMPINAVEHFDSHLEHIQRYDDGFSEENGFYFDSRHGYPGADRSLREFEADSSEQTPKEALTGNVSQQTSGTVEQNGLRSVVSQSSNTIYVPDDYAIIQEAVNATSAGDTIIIRDGTYTENIKVNMPHLTIRSENGSAKTIVHAADQNDHVFEVTTGYVNISGFTVTGATGYTYDPKALYNFKAGICLKDADLCFISNNTASNNYYGIYLSLYYYSSDKSDNIISNNTANFNSYGIYISYSGNNIISNNTAHNNTNSGIYLRSSSNNIISNNTANFNNWNGICVSSPGNILTNNTANLNNHHGIYLPSLSNSTLRNNQMAGNKYNFGVGVGCEEPSYNDIPSSNTVDGKPIYYWVNTQNMDVPSDAGYVALVNCYNITAKGLKLKNNGQGILLVNTTNTQIANNNVNNCSIGTYFYHSFYNSISRNNITNNHWGIYLGTSSNTNTISRNTIANNEEYGVDLYSSNNNLSGNRIADNDETGIRISDGSFNIISKNTITKNRLIGVTIRGSNNTISENNITKNGDGADGRGIYLSTARSFNNTICRNNITENRWGILLYPLSNNNTICGNNLMNNNDNGIFLWESSDNSLFENNITSSYYGIRLSLSIKNLILKNNITNNIYGVYFGYGAYPESSYNTVSGNNITSSSYGIYLRDSPNNDFFRNNFRDNYDNVYSWNSTNIWNSTLKITYTLNGSEFENYLGNYWDDYTDIDTNKDGIWDNHYSIDSDNQDFYPLKERFENYIEQPPSLNGKIVFHTNRDNNFEIYIMDADGTNQTRLTRNAGNDHYAVWSPDWTKIAFTSEEDGNEEIYVMNPNGTNQNRLTYNSASDWVPDFSPDGKKIAFTSNRDGNSEVYIMNSEGGNQTRLTENNADDRDPEWSIANKIVFESNRDGNPEIYLMGADGNNVIRLTHNSAVDRHPAWYSDGSKIVFTSDRDGNDEIYVMNADGSNQMRITYNSASDLDPTWSPDGNYFVFSTNRTGNYEIYRMDTDGSNQTRLTVNTNEDYRPDWGLPASIPNYPPNPLTNLAQFKSDSTTEIPVGGTTNERTVSFKGTVSDPDGDMVKLQVELRRLDEYGWQFDETKGGLKDSDFVESGSEAVAYAIELIDADYHWRARAVDEHGDSSAWQEFGGNDVSEADFWVNVINLPHADAGGLYYYGNVNEPIQFHGLATGGTPPYTYVWEFFDLDASETVIGPNPTHTWSTKGSYLAKLLVQDSAGGSNKKVCIVFVFRSDPQLEKYAPVLYFDEDEKFYPTIINALLDHSELKDQYGYVLDNPVTVDDLKPYDDEDCYLDMTIVDMAIVESMWLIYKRFPHRYYKYVAPDPKHFENYPSNIYARKEIVGADIVLQYWLFYPYNLGTLNAHEGDWELIQVLLQKYNENPYRVTYSWHKTTPEVVYGGMTYEWSEVEKVSNTHPKVYVRKGSHANEMKNKQFGKIIYPKGVDVDWSDKEKLDYFTIIDDQTQWINWKGKWGEQGWYLIEDFSGGSGPKYIIREYWGDVNVNIWQEPILWMQVCNDGCLKVLRYSPVNIHIYDQYNHHAVLTENGIFESEIPGAYYCEPEQALYLTDINEYRIFVEATEEGEFGLDIVRKTVNETTLIQYQNISITQNTTANMSINQTTTHYTMEIDIDGDGVVNEVKFPDSIETDYAPTATIILPVNESVHHYGTEIVFSGTGTDLEDGILINYSLVWYSSIDGYIDIGNTFTYANLSARTHLIELMVNDSNGQIGMENITITVIAPELVIDASNISFSNPYTIEGENITINATIHNVGTANAASVTVQFFDGNPLNGTQIGANQTIAMINAGENKNVSVAWNTSGEAGDNCIWVAVDPAASIKEPDEENNQANKSIFVGAPHVLHILNAQTDRAVYLGYEAVLINCVVENASGNISANVSADIEKPDGIIDNITLIEGLIGNYNGAFTNTSLSGIYSITIYANRTGFIGDTESLNFEVLDTTHPASITNLTHTIGATWINWTWDNPPDPDFEYTLIYLNGTWNTITAKGYQFIEGLDASTEYELGTQTVDAEGNMNENWVNQTARTSEIQLPIANFTYTPENPVVTQLITFNASNSTDPDGTIMKYEWNFGDGNVTNTTEAIINHSYASTGVYTVNLTVTDNDCATNTKTKLITVTRLCGDVAPYPNSNGKIDVGDVILLLNNVGHPGNTTYTLCNDWAGDCRCTGVRDMGDVVLLLNNVSSPENPRYVLDCC